MSTYFVTRHAGASDWASRQGLDVIPIAHLDPGMTVAGDVVIGTLPVQLAAAINARGARYLHLEINISAELRGTELSADEMVRLGATLQEYRVEKVG